MFCIAPTLALLQIRGEQCELTWASTGAEVDAGELLRFSVIASLTTTAGRASTAEQTIKRLMRLAPPYAVAMLAVHRAFPKKLSGNFVVAKLSHDHGPLTRAIAITVCFPYHFPGLFVLLDDDILYDGSVMLAALPAAYVRARGKRPFVGGLNGLNMSGSQHTFIYDRPNSNVDILEAYAGIVIPRHLLHHRLGQARSKACFWGDDYWFASWCHDRNIDHKLLGLGMKLKGIQGRVKTPVPSVGSRDGGGGNLANYVKCQSDLDRQRALLS